jgi:hypothetical protein
VDRPAPPRLQSDGRVIGWIGRPRVDRLRLQLGRRDHIHHVIRWWVAICWWIGWTSRIAPDEKFPVHGEIGEADVVDAANSGRATAVDMPEHELAGRAFVHMKGRSWPGKREQPARR